MLYDLDYSMRVFRLSPKSILLKFRIIKFQIELITHLCRFKYLFRRLREAEK